MKAPSGMQFFSTPTAWHANRTPANDAAMAHRAIPLRVSKRCRSAPRLTFTTIPAIQRMLVFTAAWMGRTYAS